MKKFLNSFILAFVISVVMYQNVLANDHWTYLYEPQFDDAYNFSDGLAIVYKDGDIYYVDPYGNELRGNWDEAFHFTEGYAMVQIDGAYGYINTEGTLVIPAVYDNGWAFSEGLALVEKDDTYCYIDYQGNIVLTSEWDDCFEFEEGLAMVVDDSEWEAVYQDYTEGILSFNEFIEMAEDGKWGYIDKEGRLVIDTVWEDAYYFQGGLARVKKEGLWGYIRSDGIAVIQPQFEDAKGFSEGLAAVQKDGLWGFIDTEGNVVIPFQYYYCGSFQDGLAAVLDEEGNYYINKEGINPFSESYQYVYSFSEGLGIVEESTGQLYYINTSGQVEIESIWDDAFTFVNGFAIVEKNGLFGFISHTESANSGSGSTYVFEYGEKEFSAGVYSVGTQVVQLREIVEALGGVLLWNQETKTVTVGFQESESSFTLNSTEYQVNGILKQLSEAPRLSEGRILLPLENLMEALNLSYIIEENIVYLY